MCSFRGTHKLKRSKPYYQMYSLKLLINDVEDFVVFLVWKMSEPFCFYKQKTPIESKYIRPTMNTNYRHIYMLASNLILAAGPYENWRNYLYSELLLIRQSSKGYRCESEINKKGSEYVNPFIEWHVYFKDYMRL